MVQKGGKAGYRSFTIIDVGRQGGCKTKFHGGRYVGRTPAGAARKAFTELCRLKGVRGVCTLNIAMQETTSSSNKKVFMYKLQRHKLKEPLVRSVGGKEWVIEYKSTIKSVNSMPDACKGTTKSRGRMKKYTAKRWKMSGNNVKKGRKRGTTRRKYRGGSYASPHGSHGF
jgi:hypothetical protein